MIFKEVHGRHSYKISLSTGDNRIQEIFYTKEEGEEKMIYKKKETKKKQKTFLGWYDHS